MLSDESSLVGQSWYSETLFMKVEKVTKVRL